MKNDFWSALENLLATHRLVIDRPKNTAHPRYPELIYPLDYGYLEGTASGDGDGIDIWLGPSGNKSLTGIICTFDSIKGDAEIKLLVGCTDNDVQTITHFLNDGMSVLYIPRPKVSKMNSIPESHSDLLKDETKAFVYLATLMKDGSPQVTPVWFNTDGEYILLNSASGRVKDRNMRARPTVALCITDPKDPYRYLQIRGRVVEITMEGAEDHIDVLNFKYHGNPNYPNHDPAHPRLIYKVLPEKIDAHG
jgi:PPOX class probable F420-dependent enzyme